MEDTDGGLVAVPVGDGIENQIMVMHHDRNVVVLLSADAVPAMVTEVVDHQIEIVGEQRPEGIVEIRSETVGVA